MSYEFPNAYPCPFCEFVGGRLPYQPIMETPLAVSFVNTVDRGCGGIIVTPRRHVETLSRLTEAEAIAAMSVLRLSVGSLLETYAPDGCHTWCTAGVIAGQSEAHVHIQVQVRVRDTPYSFKSSSELLPMPLEKRKEYARRVVRGLSCARHHQIDVPAEHMVSYEGSHLTWRQPEVTIRETLHFVALVPERMRTDFAVAIVPKRLVSAYVDMTKDESEDLILLVRLMAQAIESVCEPHGLNTWCESGAAADQKFSHMMLEMVPRRADVPYRYRPLDDVPSAPLAARAKIAERLRTWLKDHTAGAIEK